MNTYEQIKIDKDVEIQSLNAVLQKLLQNDKTMVPTEVVSPKIWVARWINGESTYNKGEAVWINTESLDDFVKSKQETIKIYLKDDSRYCYRIQLAEESENQEELISILKEGVSKGDIIYIGDITEPVQIKICLKDDTTQPPTNSVYWEDFWVTSTDEEVRNFIWKQTTSTTKSRFDQHLANYHLSGWSSSNFSDYLDTTMQNIPYDQHYHFYSHRSKNYFDGFDFVVQSNVEKFGDGIVKWYRKWNSGYLEQGGTIDIDNIGLSQDSINGDLITVNLKWDGHNDTAPYYDYVNDINTGMYGSESKIQIYEEKYDVNDYNLLGTINTYNIKVTPIIESNDSYQTYNEENCFYDVCEVMNIKNDSFTFTRDNEVKRYSFYTSGFTTHTN